ncbi:MULTISPECIES: DotI/IcmL/TraM family protein [Cysteiniphilum]|uniref:Intracellular multiplication protein IcmL n=1 Tax=Cysteiniphilum litorale TaxID=2056700 RepID=A0A8J2Z2T5_9GAMM|nr:MULTISPECIES: DotI/IcmL/TraM family protein [Cysteiniphilum]GGF91738.1 hypothetical protein GCM10010995_06180 [Cysteiniphilum litorale]
MAKLKQKTDDKIEIELKAPSYQSQVYTLEKVVFFLSVILFIIVLAMTIYLISAKNSRTFIPVNQYNQVYEYPAIAEQYFSDEYIQDYTEEVIRSVQFYNYDNLEENMRNAFTKYFSVEGIGKYVKAMNETNNLYQVKNLKLFGSVTFNGSVSIEKGLTSNGVFQWKASIPATVVTYSAFNGMKYTTKYRFYLTINRETYIENPMGLAVIQYAMRERD